MEAVVLAWGPGKGVSACAATAYGENPLANLTTCEGQGGVYLHHPQAGPKVYRNGSLCSYYKKNIVLL
jgi:hypothetical protein